MTRVFHTGFEWQSVTDGMEHRSNFDTPAIDTTIKHSGEASLRCSGSLGAGLYRGFDHLIASQTVVYARWYFYIDSLEQVANVAVTMDLFLGTTNALTLQIYNDGGGVYTCYPFVNNYGTALATFTVGIDAWHYIEVYYDTTAADGSEKVTIKYDGSDQVTRTDLTLTSKTITVIQAGMYNGSASAITGTDVYFDDIAINNGTGTLNNSWCGEGKIVASLLTGAGDNAATTGIYSYINEIPPTNTATSGSTMIELDSNGVIADYNTTDSSTLGIDSYDTIVAVSVLARVREEAAGTSSYQLRIKSASGGTVTSTTAADAGNATPRTNPASTTAWLRPLYSETDPTTGVAWTPTGTNSIDNMQIGITNVDADSTPDLWCLNLVAMIEYKEGTPPGGSVKDIIGGFGFIPFAR